MDSPRKIAENVRYHEQKAKERAREAEEHENEAARLQENLNHHIQDLENDVKGDEHAVSDHQTQLDMIATRMPAIRKEYEHLRESRMPELLTEYKELRQKRDQHTGNKISCELRIQTKKAKLDDLRKISRVGDAGDVVNTETQAPYESGVS